MPMRTGWANNVQHQGIVCGSVPAAAPIANATVSAQPGTATALSPGCGQAAGNGGDALGDASVRPVASPHD
jgi:hypothetical protein